MEDEAALPAIGRLRLGAGGRRQRLDERVLVQVIWDIAEEFPFYGYRRVLMELRRRGLRAGQKRVRRIMREEGLCAIPPRNRAREANARGNPLTARRYPNLVRRLKIDRPDQVWAADITCIGLETGFLFLAVILDVYTRRCIGWSLGRTVHDGHILRALRKALRRSAGKGLEGLIHHCDNGLVYASGEYKALLERNGIRMSLSRAGSPCDNARVERFFGTLKLEDVHLKGYRGFGDALENMRDFIEDVYNAKRLHSALGYMPPVEFENGR